MFPSKVNYSEQITHHEKVLPPKSIFQKTHRPLLKKLRKIKKTIATDSTKNREKTFFNKLNTSFVSDNKLFWKTVKPFFSTKVIHRGNVKLVEGDKLRQDDSGVAEELNNFFKEALSTLYVNENSYRINSNSINISDISINFIQVFYSLMTR